MINVFIYFSSGNVYGIFLFFGKINKKKEEILNEVLFSCLSVLPRRIN